MHQGPTYRVYSPSDLQSIAPTSLRSSPPPQKSGIFGFGFVILIVVVLIGGASFGAQKFFDGRLATQSLTAGAGGAASAASAAPSASAAAESPSPAASSSPSADATARVLPKPRRKLRHQRTAAPRLPANPYEDGKIDDLPRK